MNLIDQFKQTWSRSVDNLSKDLNDRLYKNGPFSKIIWKFEGYKDLFLLCRFGTSNYRLSIVKVGRGQNINGENRVCNLCQDRELGDEYHSNALNLNTKKK
jgi:hypothetical protein